MQNHSNIFPPNQMGIALDERFFLIATDGGNASYRLPVSLWGGVVVTGLVYLYTAARMICTRRANRKTD